jgi:Protein of unknown function (DUF998)
MVEPPRLELTTKRQGHLSMITSPRSIDAFHAASSEGNAMTANDAMASAAAPVSPVSRIAARIAFGGGLLGLVLLAGLHVLRPDLDPSWHVISEYAVGEYGWVMALCFLSLGVGSASLFVALFPQIRTVGGGIGLAFLLAAAVGLAMAAMFPMDPITVAPEDATNSGRMHGVAGAIGVPSMVVTAVVLGYALRKKPVWAPFRLPLLALGHLTWVSFVLLFVFLAILMQRHTMSGPWVVGWANRVLMVAYDAWVMITAWPAARAR